MKNVLKGYIFSRSFMGERVPQHIQNIVIRNYCQNLNHQFLLSATEYAMPGCHMILKQTVQESDNFDGIIAYSLFQFPEVKFDRLSIAVEMFKKKKELHFAVENIVVTNINDYEDIDLMWQIKQTINQNNNLE